MDYTSAELRPLLADHEDGVAVSEKGCRKLWEDDDLARGEMASVIRAACYSSWSLMPRSFFSRISRALNSVPLLALFHKVSPLAQAVVETPCGRPLFC